ncbi:Arginine kinase [Dirofilaria immitis]|nr:Arginine kinase [Dirofilaria immitis]
MIVATVVVCVVVCGYRIMAIRRPAANSVSVVEAKLPNALSPEWAVLGSEFIQEMIMVVGSEKYGFVLNNERIIQVVSQPIFGMLHWRAASAQFGRDLHHRAVIAEVQIAVPFRACAPLTNAPRMKGRIAIVQRQDCMFQEKARYVQESGAVGIIIIDNTVGTSIDVLPPFAMSGDQTVKDDIVIPAVFLYNKEGLAFIEHILHYPNALVRLSDRLLNPSYLFEDFVCHGKNKYPPNKLDLLEDIDYSEDIIVIDSSLPAVLLNYRFASLSAKNSTEDMQKVIEENIEEMQKLYNLATESDTVMFYNVIRQIGYWQLGLNMQPTEAELRKFFLLIPTVIRIQQIIQRPEKLLGSITTEVKFGLNLSLTEASLNLISLLLNVQFELVMADSIIIAKIEESFQKLQEAKDCHSLLKKYLSKDIIDELKDKKTKRGATLLDVIQSGVANLDSGVGVYAPDADSYTLFKSLFDPIIEEYHNGFGSNQKQPEADLGEIRCGRSLQDYPFNPCLTKENYKEMEDKVRRVLCGFADPELKGTYYPLAGMTKDVQKQLIEDHFLFKEGDRFLQAANACRYWPIGRGIYHNENKTFLIWINEEDHLRIISMQKGGHVGQVLERLIKGLKMIENSLRFSRDPRLGWLTFCPTNLGTTIRASVHIRLPKISAKPDFKKTCDGLKLQIRGIHGEHSESTDSIYDISNKARLGLTEFEAVKQMYDGVKQLIEMERRA